MVKKAPDLRAIAPYTGFKKIIFKQKALRGYLFES